MQEAEAPEEDIKNLMNELRGLTVVIQQDIQSKQPVGAAAGAQANGAPAGGSNPSDDDIIDAEVES